MTFTTSGGLGEFETSGLVMNILPKAGGNRIEGSLFASGTGERLQSDNLTAELSAQGVIAAPPYTKVYDISGTLGGPIATDRLCNSSALTPAAARGRARTSITTAMPAIRPSGDTHPMSQGKRIPTGPSKA